MEVPPSKRYNRRVLLRRPLIPESLLGHARAVAALTEGAALFFRAPTDANAFAASLAHKAAQESEHLGRESLKALKDPRREDWLGVLGRLSDCAAETGWAVSEAARFRGEVDEDQRSTADSLRQACAALESALRSLGDASRCQAALVACKKHAAQAERSSRRVRGSAHESANVVSGLKAAAGAKRLSQAAEALQGAADLIAEVLAVEGK